MLGRTNWAVTVLTMVSVATIVLFFTGWGSAAAAQIGSVFVANDASHPVPVRDQNTDANGNIKVHEQGTANVNVGNFPAAPTTSVVVNTSGQEDIESLIALIPQTDLEPYRSVTLYLALNRNANPGLDCTVYTIDPNGHAYQIDIFQTNDSYFTRSYDPAPPNLKLECFNGTATALGYNLMLTGRTG
jgi:hypothetical protein